MAFLFQDTIPSVRLQSPSPGCLQPQGWLRATQRRAAHGAVLVLGKKTSKSDPKKHPLKSGIFQRFPNGV